jgi:peptidoglycan/LPS O-acetylase OafA/YrhL
MVVCVRLFLLLFVAVNLSHCQNNVRYLHSHAAGQDDSNSVEDQMVRMIEIFEERFIPALEEAAQASGSGSTDETCFQDFTALAKTNVSFRFGFPKTYTTKAIYEAVDSFGKLGPGLLDGNLQLRGSFDQCLEIQPPPSMKYCTFSLMPANITTNKVLTPMGFRIDLCLPQSCDVDVILGIVKVINSGMDLLDKTIGFYSNDTLAGQPIMTCTPQGGIPYSAGAIFMIIVSVIFGVLVIIGTIYDLLYQYNNKVKSEREPLSSMSAPIRKLDVKDKTEADSLLGNTNRKKEPFSKRLMTFAHDGLVGFSMYKTIPTILSTSQPPSAITSLNGMRVISMFWVILGHSYFFLFIAQEFKNIFYVFYNFGPRLSAQPVLNGFFSVDSFFFISGFLVAYLSFRDMNRRNGKFPFFQYYVHRYLRLTPTYLFVLLFFWFLTVHLSYGPRTLVGADTTSHLYNNCANYWWTNMLYINNFYPPNFGDECMGWTWYLANDMQFYVITPLFLIPLYIWFPAGLISVGITLIASVGVTGFIAGYYQYPANVFYPTFSGNYPDPRQPDTSSQIYGKPYCRIPPYLVGILLGYVIYKNWKFNRNKYVNVLFYISIWLVASVMGLVIIYAFYGSYHGHEFSLAENVIYFMFARAGWGVCLALVVYVCHYGYGGPINQFLSMSFWVPLSRLTFNAYLFHEIVLMVILSDLRDTLPYSDLTMAIYCIATVVLSYGAAAVVSVLVEFPLSNLEMAMFKLFGVTRRESRKPDKALQQQSLIKGSASINA